MTVEPESSPSRRRTSETFTLLRSALVVALVLAIPTYGFLLARNPVASWRPEVRLEVHGDTWDGNLAADGDRVYLMTREEIDGFWGVLYVRSSNDRGRTWGEPVPVSSAGGPSAARHVLTVGPDGSLWAAWSQIGAAPSTQQLILRRSRDGGGTWDAPIRASGPDVGLVGIPALVMTHDASFVAFTDGESGAVLVQALHPDGTSMDAPVALRATTRELYGDAPFLDAGLAAAAVGDRKVLVGHDGTELWRATSPGTGRPWVTETWWVRPAWAPPRLAAAGGRLTALATVFGGSDKFQLTAETSTDGAVTWNGGATWLDPYAGDASLAVAADQMSVLWESCSRLCSVPAIRVGDVDAANGRSALIGADVGRPAGALLTADTMVVAWIREGASGRAEDRTLVVATGPRP